MVLWKTNKNFRNTQRFFDNITKKYATLHTENQRSKKFWIRGLPCYTESELITVSLKEYGFIVTRVTMLKKRKAVTEICLYMVNVLPHFKFNEIYNIKEIPNIAIKIKVFKGNNNIKQCFRWRVSIPHLKLAILRPNAWKGVKTISVKIA